jgi:uncharacterized protein DUF6754
MGTILPAIINSVILADISSTQWLLPERLANLGAVILFAAIFFALIRRARRGKTTYIRPISGLEMVEDAVGRAAEMGRPILYVPGLTDVSDPATAASLAILSKVASRAARLRTKVKVPNYSPLTWPVAQNVVRDAFIQADREEDFDIDDIQYLTSRQMTYTMSVVGMMVREKTATNFLLGHFFSESLILAETGAATGALQIGGTDSVTQLPFLITTCDYTLIGEELFAAGALISDDPINRSTIATHDWFKVAIIVLMLGGLMFGLAGAMGIEGADGIARQLAGLLTEGK